MTANVPVRRYVSPFACGTESYRPLIEVVDRTEPDHDEGPFYVLATEHERVVAELEKDSRDNYQQALATWASEFERITAERDALLADNARLKAECDAVLESNGVQDEMIAQLRGYADEVAAERDALRRDALRYRWLREPSNDDCDVIVRCEDDSDYKWLAVMGAQMDTAIDAAMTEASPSLPDTKERG